MFSEADQALKDKKIEDEIRNEILLPNIEKILQKWNEGKTPVQLDFFIGGENEKFSSKAMQIGLRKNV